MTTTTKLQRLATHVGGTIQRSSSTATCTTHEMGLIASELITPANTVHTSTICPLAGRQECENTEVVTHVI